jgi:DNA repair exonuclease SbcCD ATPase subunit
MEKLGYHKRDLLVERVEEARDSQEETKEQFQSALEKFAAVVSFEGGDLQDLYNDLRRELDQSEARAGEVRERIDSVEEVAGDLFAEWEAELEQYSQERLRRASRRQLDQTKDRYGELIRRMRAAEERIEPVLVAFRDQVLFLKHNLNARAVASLQAELVNVEADVGQLVREMEAAIDEADAFIRGMEE